MYITAWSIQPCKPPIAKMVKADRFTTSVKKKWGYRKNSGMDKVNNLPNQI